MSINLKVSKTVTVTNCPVKIINIAKKALTIKNPSYERISRITGNSWAAERSFKYYKDYGSSGIIFPRGFCGRFISYLKRNDINYELVEDFVSDKTNITFGWKEVLLRDYQVDIVNKMKENKNGVVEASVGSGKTVISCAITQKCNLKTTILVPNTVIQTQFVSEFKKWFNYDVGVINGKKKEIKDITVSTFQSLSSNPELLEKLVNQTGMLIVDECHQTISKERAKILNKFKAKRLYGLSGSPRRSKDDGRTKAIFFYFGEKIVEYKTTQIEPTVEVIYTNIDIPISINYNEMIDKMVNNKSRNKLIIGLTLGEILTGHKVLLLAKRREHCKILYEELKNYNTYYADSDDKDRNKKLLELRNGEEEFNILIGTVSMLATGLDISILDTVIFISDIKSDILVEQGAGRILRLLKDKENAKIIDLCDNKNPIFLRQFYERRKLYRDKKWKIS